MIISDIVCAMAENGCTAEQIAAVVKVMEQKQHEEIAEKREKSRLRKQKQRETEKENVTQCHAMSRDVTVTQCDKEKEKEKRTKKEKEKENNNNKYISSRARGKSPRQKNLDEAPREQDSEFERFWEGFPRQRRGSKAKARTAWYAVLRENRATVAEIMEGLRRYGTSSEVARGFAKGVSAWLNDDRWGNEYLTESQERQRYERFNGNRKYTADDALREVIDEIRADSPSGSPELCDPGYLRQDTGGTEIPDAGHDGGSQGLLGRRDQHSLPEMEKDTLENTNTG